MSQGPLRPNLTKKVQKEVSQMTNRNLPCVMLKGGLSVNLNHLKTSYVISLAGPKRTLNTLNTIHNNQTIA